MVEGVAREKLGELLCDAALKDDPELSEVQRDKYRSMPLRAPMIVIGIAENHEHKKVPAQEQVVSCGVGMGYMLLSLQSIGYNGIWRTGPMAEHAFVKAGLGIQAHESLVGFLYIGTPKGELKPVPELHTADYFHEWTGK